MVPYQIRLLSVVWALAVLVSFTQSYLWAHHLTFGWSALVAGIAAFGTLIRPESLLLLKISAVSYLVSALLMLPALPNHRMILLFIAAAMLLGSRNSLPSPSIVPTLRWLTIILYGFAALAKLNLAYMNPAVSCAGNFFFDAWKLHALPQISLESQAITGTLVAWGSTILEILIPVLLIISRTRKIGIVLGIIFHIGLATDYHQYFANFSCTMFILLLSWLPEDSAKDLYSRLCKVPWHNVAAISIFAALMAGVLGRLSYTQWLVTQHVIFLAYAVPLLIQTLLLHLPRTPTSFGEKPSALLIALALLNGFSPYLGAKTRSAFSMYSNLRIEPGFSNHLFMPASPDIFGYLKDTVQIVSTNDPQLEAVRRGPSLRLPYLSLCAYLGEQGLQMPPYPATSHILYERRGSIIPGNRGSGIPADCPPWIMRKLLFFGPVGDGSEAICQW